MNLVEAINEAESKQARGKKVELWWTPLSSPHLLERSPKVAVFDESGVLRWKDESLLGGPVMPNRKTLDGWEIKELKEEGKEEPVETKSESTKNPLFSGDIIIPSSEEVDFALGHTRRLLNGACYLLRNPEKSKTNPSYHIYVYREGFKEAFPEPLDLPFDPLLAEGRKWAPILSVSISEKSHKLVIVHFEGLSVRSGYGLDRMEVYESRHLSKYERLELATIDPLKDTGSSTKKSTHYYVIVRPVAGVYLA